MNTAPAQLTSPSLTHDLPNLVRALRQPEAYPSRPARVDVDETRASYVFPTGQYAYKIKKPPRLGFLDLATIEQRRAYCQREVELNRAREPEACLSVAADLHDAGLYFPRFNRLTYRELLRRAEATLRQRRPVILDAAFPRKQHGKPVYALGQRFAVPAWAPWRTAPEPLTHRRLDARALAPSISDGAPGIHQRQALRLEPVREAPPDQVIEIDTPAGRAEGAASLLQELYRKQRLAA